MQSRFTFDAARAAGAIRFESSPTNARRLIAAAMALFICAGCGSGVPKASFDERTGRSGTAFFNGGTIDVYTHHYRNDRTGANLSESVLNTSNVNPTNFGMLFKHVVDDQIYAQPLYVRNVAIAGLPVGQARNVVYVATMNNTIYAFDADNPGEHYPLWQRTLGTSVPHDKEFCGFCNNIGNEVGITGTPAIDVTRNAMYLVHKEYGGCGQTSCPVQYPCLNYYMHEIDIRSGADMVAPQLISYTGFNPVPQNQRAALLFVAQMNRVYVAFGGNCDLPPYRGWIFAFDAITLQQQPNVFTTTPLASNSDYGAAIWQSGNGPVADANGNIYVQTGNSLGPTGQHNTTACPDEVAALPGVYADSLVQLSPSLTFLAKFTPSNVSDLCYKDLDLGSSGPILVPASAGGAGWNLVGGGKDGNLYSWSIPASGAALIPKLDSVPTTITATQIQSTDKDSIMNIHGAPVVWDGPSGRMVYIWPEESPLTGFKIDPVSGSFDHNSMIYSHNSAGRIINAPQNISYFGALQAPVWMPGGILSLTANGSAAGTGIVWGALASSGDASIQHQPGILRAYDASTLVEIYNSDMVSGDHVGGFAKFNPPTVVNGQVHLASFHYGGALDMLMTFGLKCSTACGAGQQCIQGRCQAASQCGDGYCSQFENATTCPQDCAGLSGCYQDNSTSRALPVFLGSGHTIESCRAAAASNRYRYAGLQYFGQCYAGASIAGAQQPDSSCDTPCTANLSEGCGGSLLNRIFESCTGGQIWCATANACTLPADCCNVGYCKSGSTCINTSTNNCYAADANGNCVAAPAGTACDTGACASCCVVYSPCQTCNGTAVGNSACGAPGSHCCNTRTCCGQ